MVNKAPSVQWLEGNIARITQYIEASSAEEARQIACDRIKVAAMEAGFTIGELEIMSMLRVSDA